MKWIKLVLVFSLWLGYSVVFCQNQFNGVVSGLILDKESNKPIEFANVLLRSQTDTTIMFGTATDAKGKFRFENLSKDDYFITYSFIGYEMKKSPVISINEKNKEINLGSLLLSSTNQELEGVTVTANRSTYINYIDKKVFIVGNDLLGKTGSVSELMQNVPSVSVDMEGNVSLRGSENVMILINGKPSALMNANRAAVLEQMPASSIEKIEVITNPSAKYKPDGTSGIINIVLKKNKSLGLNGSIIGNVGNESRYNGNITANYNTGKFNFFAAL